MNQVRVLADPEAAIDAPLATGTASFPAADRLTASRPRLAHPLEPFRVLQADGTLCGALPDLSDDQFRGLYRWMLFSRELDDRAIQLQRQGRIFVWGPTRGQEAVQAGLGLALGPDDWLFPSYREHVALLMRGVDLADVFGYFRGIYWQADPTRTHVFPIQIVIGDQAIHAVGAGMAFARQKRPSVAVGVVGDGATSQGDFAEALNFAGVFKAQAVILIQNNHWAISVHRSQQSASETLAQKALAFGVEGVLVDGNDVLAVYEVMRRALVRARTGGGPSLVEALTYRLGAHTTADDPKRYQHPDELEAWAKRDPLLRMRQFLGSRGLWDNESESRAREEVLAEIDDAIARAEQVPTPPPERMFETAFGSPPARLQEQRRELEGRR